MVLAVVFEEYPAGATMPVSVAILPKKADLWSLTGMFVSVNLIPDIYWQMSVC
jgi:hypothetical protein